MIKLTQPQDVPNFCFVILNQRTQRLTKELDVKTGKRTDWGYGTDLKRLQWPNTDDPDYQHQSKLIQADLDYPDVASSFGWSIKVVQNKKEFCHHGGTDGTIKCPTCGTPAMAFIKSARQFLSNNIGATAEDPSYFDGEA